MPNDTKWAAAAARQRLQAALRTFFTGRGFLEVETPLLVPRPGMEPHIDAFQTRLLPHGASPRTLYLHTSPEYAMKRLLADGSPPIFQICKVFRNEEPSGTHNPEFTLLEFYRPQADYRQIMADLEAALAEAERAVGGRRVFAPGAFERRTVHQAVREAAGVDLERCGQLPSLREQAHRLSIRTADEDSWDDVFFRIFLQKVEPTLGADRPCFLLDYPASMAALARLKPEQPQVAERFELYVKGLELANGFSELTDAAEQRRRLEEEQQLRRALGRPAYPLDEPFLEAVGRLPPCAGVAVGLDRVLMLLSGAERIDDVLLFPARGFVP